MVPNNLQESLDQERRQMEQRVFSHYYWRSVSPANALKQLCITLHDQGKLTQGNLSELWSDCFLTDPPYLPHLESISSRITWDNVYLWLESLKPYQLWTLDSSMERS